MEVSGKVEVKKYVEVLGYGGFQAIAEVKGILGITSEEKSIEVQVIQDTVRQWIHLDDWKQDFEEFEKKLQKTKEDVEKELNKYVEALKTVSEKMDLSPLFEKYMDDC